MLSINLRLDLLYTLYMYRRKCVSVCMVCVCVYVCVCVCVYVCVYV